MNTRVVNKQIHFKIDTEEISKVIAERFPQFLSVLLGTSDKLSAFVQADIAVTKQSGVFWLERFIEKFSLIKKRAGWRNDHVLSYLIAVLSWLKNPCSDCEYFYAMFALWHILIITDPKKDLHTIHTEGLMASLEEIFDGN